MQYYDIDEFDGPLDDSEKNVELKKSMYNIIDNIIKPYAYLSKNKSFFDWLFGK
jgi:hypothetical protein